MSHDTKSSAPTFSSNLANLHKNRSPNQKSFAYKVPSDGKSLIQNRENIIGERSFGHLKDKIRKFENPPNNIHENIINRSTTSTTTIRAEEAKADADPVKSVSDQRVYDDKNSRFSSAFLINRDESKSKRIPNERCNLRLVRDGNNNQVKEPLVNQHAGDTINSFKSSLTAPRQLRDINTHCCANGDDIKVTKVVIRHLSPIVSKKLPLTTDNHDSRQHRIVHKQNSFDDNDFSFIDASSRSVSRSSISSFASDDLALCSNDRVNHRKVRIPKITRINNHCNYSQEFSVKTGANQNIYSLDQSEDGFAAASHAKAYLNNNPERSKNVPLLRASTNSSPTSNINQSIPENSVSFMSRL